MNKNEDDFHQEMRDLFTDLKSRISVLEFKIDMVQRVVYGAVGVVLVGVLTAALAWIIRQPNLPL